MFRFVLTLAILTSNVNLLSAVSYDPCSYELFVSYFPEPFVRQVLKDYEVPADKQDAIVQALTDKDDQVALLVEEKAEKMDPNPLRETDQRTEAVKLFRETLLEIFSGVLRANGFTEETKIEGMLTDMQRMKSERFTECLEDYATENLAPDKTR